MDKEIIKILLIIMFIVSYFVNLLCMFCYKPLSILIANIICWIIIIILIFGFKFIDWLNDWE